MDELWKGVRALWNGLSAAARAAVLVAAALVAAGLVWLLLWGAHGSQAVLFSDLDPRDAAAIVAELKKTKVPYQISDDGTRILVDGRVVHEVRLNLMSRGVPISGGVGFEIFDNKDVGMTESMQKINYQRALQGELARTIMANDQLQSARVHLVVDQGGLFQREKIHPKAGVSVVLKPGAHLGNSQILGIQRLVAAAVPGLEAQQVTIIDQRGVALSAEAIEEGEAAGSGASVKLRLKKETDEYLTRKVSEVLDRTFGAGQAIVSVDATLNFEEIHRTEQSIVPLKGHGDEVGAVVRRRESIYRQPPPTQTTAKAVETIADPPAPAGTPLNSSSEIEYEFSKTAEQVLSTPGGIRRISVGAIVPQGVTDDQLARVRDVIAMVVGFNAERGDAIAVQPMSRIMSQLDRGGAHTEAGALAGSWSEPEHRPTAAASTWLPHLTQTQWLLAAAAVLVCAGLALLMWRGAMMLAGDQLSGRERRELLAEIRTWIDEERARTGGVHK